MKTRVAYMELQINDISLIREIQNRFNKAYPNLWIDFYYHPNSDHSKPEKINPETAIKNICAIIGTRDINIDGEKSVAELEADFKELLGLEIKVLRKTRNVWVGTPYTRNWSLQNQNHEGKQIY